MSKTQRKEHIIICNEFLVLFSGKKKQMGYQSAIEHWRSRMPISIITVVLRLHNGARATLELPVYKTGNSGAKKIPRSLLRLTMPVI